MKYEKSSNQFAEINCENSYIYVIFTKNVHWKSSESCAEFFVMKKSLKSHLYKCNLNDLFSHEKCRGKNNVGVIL
jgi:hypothetical protein